jgi:hypothetical protein
VASPPFLFKRSTATSPFDLFSRMGRPTRSTPKSASATPGKVQTTPTRSSRARPNKKSKYFEPSSDDGDSSFDDDKLEPTPDSDSVVPSETEEDEPPKKKTKVTPKKPTPQKSTQKLKSSREKKEYSVEEPWETFIPKEDTPDSGDVAYENSTLHPNTLSFLKGVFDFDVY